MILGTLTLGLGIWVGYWVWRQLPGWNTPSLPWLPLVLPVLAGLVTLIASRAALGFLTRPFRGGGDPEAPRSPLRRGLALVFSLVPTSALWFAGAAAVRHAGSVAEIRDFVEHGRPAAAAPGESAGSLAVLKGSIERLIPAGWFERVDPFSDQARVTLAKLIALGQEGAPPKAIPVLEEPEIRSLILNDPELRALARDRRYAEILRDPRLDRVMADPDLRRMLSGLPL